MLVCNPYIFTGYLFLIMVSSSSTLRSVRLSTVITAAGAGVVVVLLLLSNINVNNNNTLLQSKSVFAQLEEEEGGVVTEAEENATANATPTDNNNMTGVTFLFIQHAQSGSVSEVNATTSTLELSDVSDKTIMFSDRPDRIVASQSTSDFVGNWTMGEDSFAADPPNAVLILDDDDEVEQRQDLAIIELYNPEYDSEANTLRYDIVEFSAVTTTTATTTTTTTPSINLPSEFGQSTLVIDAGEEDVHWCYSRYTDDGSSVEMSCFPTQGQCDQKRAADSQAFTACQTD
jgi:hypothetical protein